MNTRREKGTSHFSAGRCGKVRCPLFSPGRRRRAEMFAPAEAEIETDRAGRDVLLGHDKEIRRWAALETVARRTMLREVHAVERRRPAAQLAGDGGQRVQVVDELRRLLMHGLMDTGARRSSMTNHVRACRKHDGLRMPCPGSGEQLSECGVTRARHDRRADAGGPSSVGTMSRPSEEHRPARHAPILTTTDIAKVAITTAIAASTRSGPIAPCSTTQSPSLSQDVSPRSRSCR